MKKIRKCFNLLMCLAMFSCNSDKRITELLNSRVKDDIILGATKAGESGKKKFTPLLLKNAEDWRTSTNFNYKGVSVYQAKMEALRKIFKKNPPTKITYKPDSTIITFYTELFLKEKE